MGVIDRIWLVFAALNGAAAVAAGAYATHGLAGDPHGRELFHTAGQYQMWHVLALLGLALLARRSVGPARIALRLAGWLFVVGITLFSGTLYALALNGPLPVPMTAPTGGSSLILGWIVLALTALLFGRSLSERVGASRF